MRTALTFALGVLFMLAAAVDPADGQEKKDPDIKAPYDQFVKIEGVRENGEPFLKERMPAYRRTSKINAWRVPTGKMGSGHTGLKSVVVTDKDGKKYPIKKVSLSSELQTQLLIDEPAPKPE